MSMRALPQAHVWKSTKVVTCFKDYAHLSMPLGGLTIATEEVHIRMCAHDITINLLHHFTILQEQGH